MNHLHERGAGALMVAAGGLVARSHRLVVLARTGVRSQPVVEALHSLLVIPLELLSVVGGDHCRGRGH